MLKYQVPSGLYMPLDESRPCDQQALEWNARLKYSTTSGLINQGQETVTVAEGK